MALTMKTKGVSFPKDELKMAYIFFYDKDSIYVPLNEEEQKAVQELYDYNDRMGIPTPLTVYDIGWGVVCEFCDDDSCKYCIKHYESIDEKNSDDDNAIVNADTSITITTTNNIDFDDKDDQPNQDDASSISTASITSASSSVDSSSISSINNNKYNDSPVTKPRKIREKRCSRSKPKREKSSQRQQSNKNTVKPAAPTPAPTAVIKNSTIAPPKSRVNNNNNNKNGNFHTMELDDDSIGWVQPEWTKKLNLKMSDKGTAVRTKGICLAQPVTFCKKDPNRGVNNVANKTILKASDTWQKFQDSEKAINLAKPITFCEKDPKRTVNLIANMKVLRASNTWKRGNVVNLAKPVTFCKQKSTRNVNYIANKNVLKSTDTWKHGNDFNLAKPVTFCKKDSNRNLNLVANQQILKKKNQINKKTNSTTRRRSIGTTYRGSGIDNTTEFSRPTAITSSHPEAKGSNAPVKSTTYRKFSNTSTSEYGHAAAATFSYLKTKRLSVPIKSSKEDYNTGCSSTSITSLDSNSSNDSSDSSTDGFFKLKRRVSTGGVPPSVRRTSMQNRRSSLDGGLFASQSILAKTDLGERIRLGKDIEFNITSNVVIARTYQSKNDIFLEKPKWARTQLRTTEQGKHIRLGKTVSFNSPRRIF